MWWDKEILWANAWRNENTETINAKEAKLAEVIKPKNKTERRHEYVRQTNRDRLPHTDIWAASWQNQQSGFAPNEDSDQPGHPPSLIRAFAVRSMGAKDQTFLHADSEDSDQTGRMPRLKWVFAGCTATLLVLSWGSSYTDTEKDQQREPKRERQIDSQKQTDRQDYLLMALLKMQTCLSVLLSKLWTVQR